jgi:hypothetical protein
MYLAELHGKVPTNLEGKEDLLTSNVFSFFKYSDRLLYLKQLMDMLGVAVSDDDLDSAEFQFWPTYDDRTEPDLVIIVGKHYLLIEAKHLSDFTHNEGEKAQLLREIEGGLNEAKSLGKEFLLIAVTSDYVFPSSKFEEVLERHPHQFKWINWQAISLLLLTLIEQYGSNLPYFLFAADLYRLLERKRLRSFRGFEKLLGRYGAVCPDPIFFSAENAKFRGRFIGFSDALAGLPKVQKPRGSVFYSRMYFRLEFLFDVNECDWFRKRGKMT